MVQDLTKGYAAESSSHCSGKLYSPTCGPTLTLFGFAIKPDYLNTILYDPMCYGTTKVLTERVITSISN